MKGMDLVKGVLVSLAAVGFCLPHPVLAASADVDRVPVVTDVGLSSGGVLVGQVVDSQGIALAKVPVSLQGGGREIARAQTDANGYFAVRGLRGGVHQLVTPGAQGTFRLWKSDTAPPLSQEGALLIVDRQMVRGQSCEPGCEPGCGIGCGSCCKGLSYWLANPWVVTGIVATAVAVPVAIHNSGRPSSP